MAISYKITHCTVLFNLAKLDERPDRIASSRPKFLFPFPQPKP